jgi:hypothetical protein
MNSFQKQPYEQYPVAVEFSGKLPTGTTISSMDVAVTLNGVDVTSTVIDESYLDSTRAVIVVKGGEDKKDYKFTIQILLSDGSKLEEDLIMGVREL